MKRWLKTFLILIAIFLIPTLWLLVSHILAKHALERYKVQLRAAGEKLTIDELLPPYVPPDKNGAKLFTQAFPYLHFEGLFDSNPPPATRMVAPGKAMIGWQQSEIVSVYDPPILTNSWRDIEQELKQHALGLDLLRQAVACPELDFGLDYHDTSLSGTGHLSKIKNATQLLSASAVLDLSHAETASSVTNLHTLLTIVNKWKDERLLISQLVHTALPWIACGAQWEVLQATNLTDPELAALQRDWESMELVQPMENALKMERVWDLAMIEQLRNTNDPSASFGWGTASGSGAGGSSDILDVIKNIGQSASEKTGYALWRVSWSYGDELRQMQVLQVAIETVHQIEANGFFVNALTNWDGRINALGLNNQTNNWLRNHLDANTAEIFGDISDIIDNAMDRLLRSEATRRITITAIALKRYQLRYGNWPLNLTALVPEFLSELPRDPVDGQPLRYRAKPDGTFTLYSIGSDNKDDGGDPTPVKATRTMQWQRGRDWVWPQPATPEEIQQYYTNLQQRSSVYK